MRIDFSNQSDQATEKARVTHIRRSALVRCTPAQMFDLVNEIECYPQRFAWCDGAAVLERGENMLVARLDLRFSGLKRSFTTRNTFDRPKRLALTLVDGPFRSLHGAWDFVALGEHGCKVIFALDFEYLGGVGDALIRLGFERLASRMVDDFCAQVEAVYG